MIREADPDDIDDIYALWHELLDMHQSHHPVFRYKPGSDQELHKELLSRLKARDTRFFGYVRQDEWQGLIVATLKQSAPGFRLSRKGYIAETIVKERYRGTGVGSLLVEAARNWLIDHGADHIELQVSVKNKAGIRFWERQGFTPSTQHMVLAVSPKNQKD
ncbi:GNAT family N-acetyltransferase [Pontibacter sp. E15-1]|uniref:GNAT family N-acetyltransferase n=1 Tax=Pontibacter sp. E15-1 TaxID=2919918 RepID=UPI001F4FFBDD|nr:GNAT family N-acetyltransferase [Pontibacter sp. E15-1]MCJ8165919.1 GNAT family N-acetyltransferase [Pontibacter sp. E15-1]